ncbi:MAG: hypothetical protein MMC23_001877 [Stictis urceolatum]|nr:hypothetical protein [Stictis urceolata]
MVADSSPSGQPDRDTATELKIDDAKNKTAEDKKMNGERTSSSPSSIWQRVLSVLLYTPERCRWDPDKPIEFSMALNLLFAFAACFTVASLYYSHPILNILAEDFGVTYEQVSIVPTLAQAGYAAGLLFLCPLGDLFKRRIFVLSLVWITGTVWIGLCLTTSFPAFAALSFINAATTVTPQLMLPLVGELAPPHRRATALSIMSSGLLLGILIARVLSGTVTNFVSWRVIYWIGFGLQYLILILLWFFMPDYPSTNPSGLNYFRMLWSIVTITYRSPVLVQACIVGMLTSATFTNYWTTLTFLLSGEPYNFSSLVIGLFGFIGIAAMCLGPPYSRVVIDRLTPLISTIIGEIICLIGITIGTYTGTFTIAGPIVQAVLMDFGMQTSQTANRTSIYQIDSKARNRINTAYMVSVFCGQLIGTSVGNHLYAEGGWVHSGNASVGFIAGALAISLVRGPWENGWVGWRGGWGWRRRDLGGKGKDVEKSGGVKDGAVSEKKGDEPERAQETAIADEMSMDGPTEHGDSEKGTELDSREDGKPEDGHENTTKDEVR